MKTNTLVLQHSGSYEDGCWWKMADSVAATIHKAAALVLAVFADLSLFYASGLAATHSVVGHLVRLWVSAALRALALTAVTLFTLGDLRPWLIRFIAAYTLLPAVFETGTKALYHEESQCSQMAGVRCWMMCAGASLAAALFWEITVPDTDEEAADKKSKQKARVLFVRVLLLFKPDYLLLLGGFVFLSLAVLCEMFISFYQQNEFLSALLFMSWCFLL